jgi:hypothetical protein
MIRMVQLRKLLSSFQGDIPIYPISSPCGDSYYAGLKVVLIMGLFRRLAAVYFLSIPF